MDLIGQTGSGYRRMKSGETKERSKVPPKMNENRMKKRDNAGKNDILYLETKDCSNGNV